MKPNYLKSFLLSALMLSALIVSAQQKTVQILTVNDMHAYLDRAANLGGVVDSIRAHNPNLFIVSAGDNRTGNPINDQYEEPSRPMTEVMNAIGFNASAIGNHEFDAKVAGFKKQLERSKFSYLCANISVPDSMGFKIHPYQIFDVDGVKIGVIGSVQVNPHRNHPDCHSNNCKGLTFYEPQATIAKYVDIVRKQCDIEILLSHNGVDQDSISCQKYPQFDAIMGGHSHEFIPANAMVNGVLLTQSVNKLKYATLCTFIVEDGKVISKKSEIIDLQTTKQRNAKVAEMVEQFNQNTTLNRVLCIIDKDINGYEKLGCLMSDGQRYSTGVDIVLQNGGGVRYDKKEAGNFTEKDGLMLDPFGNEMIIYRLKGLEIKQAIMDCYVNDEYVEGYTSGVSYVMTVKDKKPIDIEVTTEKGKPLKNRKTYKFACNSYVSSIIPLIKAKEGTHTNRTSYDCIREYLEHQGHVDYSNTVRSVIKRSK